LALEKVEQLKWVGVGKCTFTNGLFCEKLQCYKYKYYTYVNIFFKLKIIKFRKCGL